MKFKRISANRKNDCTPDDTHVPGTTFDSVLQISGFLCRYISDKKCMHGIYTNDTITIFYTILQCIDHEFLMGPFSQREFSILYFAKATLYEMLNHAC